MFYGKIDVAKGFQSSINIGFDLHDNDKIRSFIPTMSSLDIIEDVMLSTVPMSLQRARIFIGAYGRGKSHIILVLMSLLIKKDRTLFQAILEKMRISNPKLYDFVVDYIESDSKLLPIVVSGSSTSLTQSFLSALQRALRVEGLNDLMPETHFRASLNTIDSWRSYYPETYKRFVDCLNEPIEDFLVALKEYNVSAYEKFITLYPGLTAGSTFNPFLGFDVVELYEKVVEKLSDKGFDGVYIIYDEFSKFLESSIANTTISDIKLLQDFAEKCNRSGHLQMHLMLICHKDIANYIDNNLPKEKVDGWRGVSGRFKHINLHNNFSQIYEIISAVIKKDPIFWSEYCATNQDKFDDLAKRYLATGLFDSNDIEAIKATIKGCYPLHPISTFILPRLSEKVAQNERTLFTFLSTEDKHTLSAFLSSAQGDFPMLTPDYLYDYFESLLRKEPYTSEIHKLYKLTNNVLRKVSPNSLEAKIIKTISLIYIVEQFEKLSPIYDAIVNSFQDYTGDTKLINNALNTLIDKDCIVYLRRSNNYLKLKESSGIDIPGEIDKVIEKNRNALSVKEILNGSVFDSYMYPTRYNDEHEITRYFDFTFIESSDFWSVGNWDMRIRDSEADGVVFAIIPENREEISAIRESILKGNYNHERIVFVLPKKYKDIEKIAFEYKAVLQLKSLAEDDELLCDEYDIYIEDLEQVISNFVSSYARPENGGAEYFHDGQKKNLNRKAHMSELLSEICEIAFPLTPVINNESINKNHLPTVAVNSRTKILSGLLETHLEVNLGLSGTGQDVSIMRSTLIRTGILVNIDTAPTIEMNPLDANISNVLHVIQRFFNGANANGGQCFSVLYDILTLPQHKIGLKRGVIPIYVAVVLHLHKQNLVILSNGNEAKITPDLLNSINENPGDYSVIVENWNEEKAQYMAELETIFAQYINEKEKAYNSFTYLVLAINRWYMSLPKYAKELTSIYLGSSKNEKFKQLSKSEIRFIGSLKQLENNPREYLFEKLFSIFGMREFSLEILECIRSTKREFDNAVPELIKVLVHDVKALFADSCDHNCTLASSIKDWYENLNAATIQHMFPRNENKILELMKSVTNDEMAFIQRLCKAVTALRIDDWNTATIAIFLRDLEAFKETVQNFNRVHDGFYTVNSDMYKLIFIDSAGQEVIKTFGKTKYSDRAKLLLNEIATSLEEMGQSISEHEKRQVLIELLEKMC